MKKFRHLILGAFAIVLVISLLTGCAGAKEPDETDTMVHDWEQFLNANEQIHTTTLWAFSYAKDYALKNDWDSLLKARAAASAALTALRQLELPEYTLTDEQCDALLAAGIEADVILTEYAALPQTLQFKQDTLALLNYHLTRDIFVTPDAEMFAQWVDSSLKITDIDAKYNWMTTNYLLLQLKQEKLWDTWQEQFPGLGKAAPQWENSSDQLMRNTDSILDEMADELVLYSGYLGASDYALSIVKDAAATGDLTELSRNMNRIEGVPGYFPVPEWLPDVLWLYFVDDPETDDKVMIHAGDNISQVPTACYIGCSGISLEEAKEYAQSLREWGLEPYETEENGTYQALVEQGSSYLLLEWDTDKTLLYLSDPVGSLIPSLYLAALNS